MAENQWYKKMSQNNEWLAAPKLFINSMIRKKKKKKKINSMIYAEHMLSFSAPEIQYLFVYLLFVLFLNKIYLVLAILALSM